MYSSKYYNFKRSWNLLGQLGNTHPSDSEWRKQKRLANVPFVGNWYADYMRSKSLDERNNHLLSVYGYKPSDTRYPWLTGTTNEQGSVQRGYQIMSHNITKLYNAYNHRDIPYYHDNSRLPGYY